ncbi:ThiF family adenylyltransferase [Bythopirellula goksoeyrii]|uniref:ThiF family adenylyltransferase n=1 Tax=Bythopirellula goksoeyrii TaxID=1400387 RepID=UPI00143D3AC7|nr:E2/UBC family protein [Bythopirellula goksoeyrii]
MVLERRFSSAIAEVHAKLLTGPWQVSILTTPQLRRYRNRGFQHGWRLVIPHGEGTLDFDVLVTEHFPHQPPRISLATLQRFLVWPHVEEDGVLCLLSSEATINSARPGEVTLSLLQDALQLVLESEIGNNQQDFRNEFTTYWGRKCPEQCIPVWSLLSPDQESRLIPFWSGKEFCLIGESTEQLEHWLNNATKKRISGSREYRQGILLPLPQLPCPKDFPKNGRDLIACIEQSNAKHLIESIHQEGLEGYLAVLAGKTPTGTAFGGVIARVQEKLRYPAERRGGSIIDGFRPGKAPKEVVQSQIKSSLSISLTTVERADALWIHGRGSDPKVKTLQSSTIAILGCGSIGSHLAFLLAEAGVGKLVLCDPEPLKWANVGRHALASDSVGTSKAKSLATTLKNSYPSSVGFDGYCKTWEGLASSMPEKLLTCDLLIAATGNWTTEASLNAWRKTADFRQPLLYCWAEAFAAAGHAIAIFPDDGCLQCGFSPLGLPKLSVTSWSEKTILQEAGCDTSFQPYGPIALSHIVSLAAELALDCLLGSVCESTERIWCGNKRLAKDNGGTWSEEWKSLVGDREQGSFTQELPWVPDKNCLECSFI